MFKANLDPVPFCDPWDLTYQHRLRMLVRGKLRIAYYYEAANNSTFRYRSFNMVNVINSSENKYISASYFFLTDLQHIDEIANSADILIICRSGYNHYINQLITRFRVNNKRILFDIDDLVFNTKYAHLIIETLGQDVNDNHVWDYWFSYIARMGETLKLCDGAITTNEYLSNQISEFVNIPVSVIPNFINQEQLILSEKIFHEKKLSQFSRNERINLGYFSGSPSHNLDYEIILPALEEVLESNPEIDLTVVGYIEPGACLHKFGNRIQRQPFHDYVNLQRLISRVEFNLMPLQSNTFTNCKSELKYFEAAIVGTLSIASPSYTYGAAITNGMNGYLAKAHQWSSTIKTAISNINNYQVLAERAFEDAYKKYAHTNQFETIINGIGI